MSDSEQIALLRRTGRLTTVGRAGSQVGSSSPPRPTPEFVRLLLDEEPTVTRRGLGRGDPAARAVEDELRRARGLGVRSLVWAGPMFDLFEVEGVRFAPETTASVSTGRGLVLRPYLPADLALIVSEDPGSVAVNVTRDCYRAAWRTVCTGLSAGNHDGWWEVAWAMARGAGATAVIGISGETSRAKWTYHGSYLTDGSRRRNEQFVVQFEPRGIQLAPRGSEAKLMLWLGEHACGAVLQAVDRAKQASGLAEASGYLRLLPTRGA